MRYYKKNYSIEHGSTRSKLVILTAIVVIMLSGCAVFVATRSPHTATNSPTPSTKAEAAETTPMPTGKVGGRYLFSGTIVLARAVEKVANGNYAQPFSKLSTFKPEQYDGWLADLECPVTNANISYQEQVQNLVFNCRPEWLPTLSKYFNLINLANNHSGNMGEDGFQETRKNLTDAGIQVIGNYDPSITKDMCQIVALPVRVIDGGKTTKAELPVAFCAAHYFFRNPYPGEMDVVKKYSEVMPVFGFMHVGVEYVPKAGPEQHNVGHILVDNGAEFVVANSPHWVQDGEVYKGKPIFYSTGNFIFDQLDSETNRGLNVDVSMEVTNDDNLQKWLAIGSKCKPLYDTCLDEIRASHLAKPQLKLKYEPIANISGVRVITEKANPAIQAGVEDRLGWAKMKTELGQ